MKALYSSATPVAWARVAREHRAALLPLGIVLGINLVLLFAVVLPLSRRVAANEQRAQTAAQAEATAAEEFRRAEAVREGKTRATADLETFYRQVLPVDVAAARRIVQGKIVRLAEAHDVEYSRSSSDTEEIKESTLQRFTVSMTLAGNYEDIRAFIYELETAPEFVVIENLVLQEGLNTTDQLKLSWELSTYFRAPGAVTTAATPRAGNGAGSGQATTNGR